MSSFSLDVHPRVILLCIRALQASRSAGFYKIFTNFYRTFGGAREGG